MVLVLGGQLATSGCVSVGAAKAEPLVVPGSQCSVEVHVYDTTKARDSDVPTSRTIVSELWREAQDGKVLVREARDATWTADEVPPGKYVVRVRKWVDATGAVHRLASSDSTSFELGPGERVRADVVLRHPKRAVVAAIVVTAVAAALVVLLVDTVVSAAALGGT